MAIVTRRDVVRRTVGVVLTALLVAAAVVFFISTPRSALSEGRSPGTAGSAPTAGNSGSGATGAGSVDPSGAADPSPSGSGADSGPSSATTGSSSDPTLATGPGRTAAGVQLIGQPRSDGSWDVVEYVRLASPGAQLALALPQISRAGGPFASKTARVTDLQADADDQVATITSQGPDWQVDSATPATQYVLRYVLGGATVRSVPSKAGRALTVLAPVADPAGGAVPVQIVAVGSTIRAVQCPLLSGDGQLCQAGAVPNLRLGSPLPERDALALIQFDLPAPR